MKIIIKINFSYDIPTFNELMEFRSILWDKASTECIDRSK